MVAGEENIDELDDGFESEEDDNGVFKVRDMLQPPSAKSFSTKELHSKQHFLYICADIEIHSIYPALIHQGTIDLNPPYQRGETKVLLLSVIALYREDI